jgi:hypothetical protein
MWKSGLHPDVARRLLVGVLLEVPISRVWPVWPTCQAADDTQALMLRLTSSMGKGK